MGEGEGTEWGRPTQDVLGKVKQFKINRGKHGSVEVTSDIPKYVIDNEDSNPRLCR